MSQQRIFSAFDMGRRARDMAMSGLPPDHNPFERSEFALRMAWLEGFNSKS